MPATSSVTASTAAPQPWPVATLTAAGVRQTTTTARSSAMKPSERTSSGWRRRPRRHGRPVVARPRRRVRAVARGRPGWPGRGRPGPAGRTAGPRPIRCAGRPSPAAGAARGGRPGRRRAGTRCATGQGGRAGRRQAPGAARRQPPPSSRRATLEEAPEQHDAERAEGDGEGQGLSCRHVGCDGHVVTPWRSDDVEQYPEEQGDEGDEAPEVGAPVRGWPGAGGPPGGSRWARHRPAPWPAAGAAHGPGRVSSQ